MGWSSVCGLVPALHTLTERAGFAGCSEQGNEQLAQSGPPASHTFLWHWESEQFICTDQPCVRCDRSPSHTMSGYETHTMSGYENKGARIKAYMEQLGKQWNLNSLVVILATRWVIIGYFTNFVSTFYRIGAKVPSRSKNQGFLWQLWNKEKVNTRP